MGCEWAQFGHIVKIPQNNPHSVFIALVIGVELQEPVPQPDFGVVDDEPRFWVRRRIRGPAVARTGTEQVGHRREMPIEGRPLDASALSNRRNGGVLGPERRMQFHRSLDNPLPRLRLPLGAPLEFIFAPHQGSILAYTSVK